MLDCPSKVRKLWAFSVTSLRFKSVMRIRDDNEILNTAIMPANNIMIIKNGEEVTENCRFFSYEPYMIKRERARYPQGPLTEQDAWTMPFASLVNRPPLARPTQSSMDFICPECLLDCSEAPPDYQPGNQDVEKPLIELAGKINYFLMKDKF
jgi:hypothetical protein